MGEPLFFDNNSQHRIFINGNECKPLVAVSLDHKGYTIVTITNGLTDEAMVEIMKLIADSWLQRNEKKTGE